MHKHIRNLLLAGVAAVATWPAMAGEVTPERLVNADKEPQNWLMNHRTYDAQRYSPLDKINKANVKSLKLAYAVAIGGTAKASLRFFTLSRLMWVSGEKRCPS